FPYTTLFRSVLRIRTPRAREYDVGVADACRELRCSPPLPLAGEGRGRGYQEQGSSHGAEGKRQVAASPYDRRRGTALVPSASWDSSSSDRSPSAATSSTSFAWSISW